MVGVFASSLASSLKPQNGERQVPLGGEKSNNLSQWLAIISNCLIMEHKCPLQISQPSNNPKKIIWMDCGIHAREWIAPAFCQWFVKEVSVFNFLTMASCA